MNDELNPKLFDTDKSLKEDIRQALIDIADTFVKDIKENDIPIEVMDYWLVGSNASYNYSTNSDIDVHIIANMEDIDCNGLLTIVYNYAKSDFNKTHKITVKGMPVEVYIESRSSSAISNGVYSLLENDWVKFPKKLENIPEFVAEESELFSETNEKVLDALESESIDEIQDTINSLYLMRKASLAEDGEFGEGNLVFKEFRNNGRLDKLKERKKYLIDQELTLEQLKENKRMKKSRRQLMIGPGDPAKNIAIFNANMTPGGSMCVEDLNEENKRFHWEYKPKNNPEETWTIDVDRDKDSCEIFYPNLDVTFSYVTGYEADVNAYDTEETVRTIDYTYTLFYDMFLSALEDALSPEEHKQMLAAWDEGKTMEDWVEEHAQELLDKYGLEIYSRFEDDARLEAGDTLDLSDIDEPIDPPEYEPDDYR